jgi:hypothetical protein
MKKCLMGMVIIVAILFTTTVYSQNYFRTKDLTIGFFDKNQKLTLLEPKKLNISVIVHNETYFFDDKDSNFYITHGDPRIKDDGDYRVMIQDATDKFNKPCKVALMYMNDDPPQLHILYKTYVLIYVVEPVSKK